MMTRQNLLLLPSVKLPAVRKTLSSTLVIHPLHQVWNHPGTLVSCLIQPVVLMIMWTKFAKILTISCIPSVKFESTLANPRRKKMINSAMTSRLEYCNSLLYGINGYLVSQLLRCQNDAALIVSLRRIYDHIAPVLKDLHWLPVEYRINYQILLLAYRAQHGMAPPYLSSLLHPTNLGGLYDLRVNISWRHFLIAWQVLANVVLRMTPLLSGTFSPSPSSVHNNIIIIIIMITSF